MTLYELVNDITVQGAIRVSSWNEHDEEDVLFQTDGTDDFGCGDLEDEWEDREVKYIFCPGDGFLHIEIE